MIKTLVANSYELYKLLEKEFGKRFNADPLIAMMGRISGTFDSQEIRITFDGKKYLIISTSPNSKNILEELHPFLKTIMGNENPICSYDLQGEGLDESDAMPTTEWDIDAPEERIKEIVNGRAFANNCKIHNLELYNDRKISDYLESDLEKEERIKNSRIYGIDPGSIQDVEKVNNLSEIDLYFAIDAMGRHIWRCRHEMNHGRIPQIDLTEEQFALEYMVNQTTKFGVELSPPEVGKHITATTSYNIWYQFYSNHFKNFLTNEQWNAFQQAQRDGQDTSAFMPSGNWKDLLKKTDQPTIK